MYLLLGSRIEKAYDKIQKDHSKEGLTDEEAETLIVQILNKNDAAALRRANAAKNRPDETQLKEYIMNGHDSNNATKK